MFKSFFSTLNSQHALFWPLPMLLAHTMWVEQEQQKKTTDVYGNFPIFRKMQKITISFQGCPTNESQDHRRSYTPLSQFYVFSRNPGDTVLLASILSSTLALTGSIRHWNLLPTRKCSFSLFFSGLLYCSFSSWAYSRKGPKRWYIKSG